MSAGLQRPLEEIDQGRLLRHRGQARVVTHQQAGAGIVANQRPGIGCRAEIALRAVFGKIFPKERPLPLLPEAFVEDPKLADLKVLQATATDGWMAISLGESPTPAERPAAAGKVASPQHSGPRRTKRR